MTEKKQVYQCDECGLHYKDKKTAELCEAWCKERNSCNLEITRLSLEAQSEKGETNS